MESQQSSEILSVGEQLVGRYNPNDDPEITYIKQLAIDLINAIEKFQTTSRIGAATKTSAQMAVLDGQMKAVKLKYVK